MQRACAVCKESATEHNYNVKKIFFFILYRGREFFTMAKRLPRIARFIVIKYQQFIFMCEHTQKNPQHKTHLIVHYLLISFAPQLTFANISEHSLYIINEAPNASQLSALQQCAFVNVMTSWYNGNKERACRPWRDSVPCLAGSFRTCTPGSNESKQRFVF